jgi:hypothetical protein
MINVVKFAYAWPTPRDEAESFVDARSFTLFGLF